MNPYNLNKALEMRVTNGNDFLDSRKTWRSFVWLFTAWMMGKLNLPSVRSSQKLLLSEYCEVK